MKRFHVHVAVADLAESIRFYSTLFGAGPTVRKEDYAKWMLDDPRVNFAVSKTGSAAGLDHLGIQVESSDDLNQIAGRLADAARPVLEQKNAACCYARSDKAWTTDPQGLSWETFFTTGEHTTYGEDIRIARPAPERTVAAAGACCSNPAPEIKAAPAGACCAKPAA
ncbi:MAG TPA: ArsI/CadI family heavy metal resistance metalloenzyme [Candidatus Binataceae bacterium]|nr:ArsI/CadI family heavy metal resistance metalloenzyme [Candidatus Binataceae bacterium]